MKYKLAALSRQYRAALRKHLHRGGQASSRLAPGLGRRAVTMGLQTLDLARIHEQALITLVLPAYSPGTRKGMVQRAGRFFADAITPIETTHRIAREANVQMAQMNRTLRARSVELAASNRQLKKE